MQHQYSDLIQLFNTTFSQEYNTRLIKGGDEPIYLPANQHCDFHQVIFAHGYYASALHEIAHWCQAGKERRLLEDFGYWYMPDGRNEQQQNQFEQVEVIPQAIEWAFNVAAGKVFNISADNLNGAETNPALFKSKVVEQVVKYLEDGFPKRANTFIQVLAKFYNVNFPLTIEQFNANNPSIIEQKYVGIYAKI